MNEIKQNLTLVQSAIFKDENFIKKNEKENN